MSNMGFQYDVKIMGLEETIRQLELMSLAIGEVMKDSLEEASQESEIIMKFNIPTRTGSFKDSIDHEIRRDTSGMFSLVGPNDSKLGSRPVGISVEAGRRSGAMPNYIDIQNRYGVDISAAFAIAKKIAQSGTRGINFMDPTASAVKPVFEAYGLKTYFERLTGLWTQNSLRI